MDMMCDPASDMAGCRKFGHAWCMVLIVSRSCTHRPHGVPLAVRISLPLQRTPMRGRLSAAPSEQQPRGRPASRSRRAAHSERRGRAYRSTESGGSHGAQIGRNLGIARESANTTTCTRFTSASCASIACNLSATRCCNDGDARPHSARIRPYLLPYCQYVHRLSLALKLLASSSIWKRIWFKVIQAVSRSIPQSEPLLERVLRHAIAGS